MRASGCARAPDSQGARPRNWKLPVFGSERAFRICLESHRPLCVTPSLLHNLAHRGTDTAVPHPPNSAEHRHTRKPVLSTLAWGGALVVPESIPVALGGKGLCSDQTHELYLLHMTPSPGSSLCLTSVLVFASVRPGGLWGSFARISGHFSKNFPHTCFECFPTFLARLDFGQPDQVGAKLSGLTTSRRG